MVDIEWLSVPLRSGSISNIGHVYHYDEMTLAGSRKIKPIHKGIGRSETE